MKAEQKLHRALTKLIYEYFENGYYPLEGEAEDYLITCIHKAKRITKKYHKDKTAEEWYNGETLEAYA